MILTWAFRRDSVVRGSWCIAPDFVFFISDELQYQLKAVTIKVSLELINQSCFAGALRGNFARVYRIPGSREHSFYPECP